MSGTQPATNPVSRSRLQAMVKRRRFAGNTSTNGKAANADNIDGCSKVTTPENKDACSKANNYAKAIMQYLVESDYDAADAYLDARVKGFRGTSCKAFYHSIINACGRAGAADAAVWCAARMVRIGLRPNVVTFNSLLDASAKAADINLANYVWRVMSEYGTKPNGITYNTMINACAQARDADAAEYWIETMQQQGLKPCAVSYSTLMSAFAKTGKADKAELWYARMREANIEADRVIFNSLVDVAARAALADKAEQWFLQMVEAGIKPEKKAFNSVIQACAKRGDVERAEYWLNRMEKTCRSDKATFTSMIYASIKSGNVARAESWINAMASRGLVRTTSVYNDVLHHAFETQDDYDGAVRWYNKMLQDGVKPNNATFNRILNVCKRKNPAATQHWMCEMYSQGCQPTANANTPVDNSATPGGTQGNWPSWAEGSAEEFDDFEGTDEDSLSGEGFASPSQTVGDFRAFVAKGGSIHGPPGLDPPAHLRFPAASAAFSPAAMGAPTAGQAAPSAFMAPTQPVHSCTAPQLPPQPAHQQTPCRPSAPPKATHPLKPQHCVAGFSGRVTEGMPQQPLPNSWMQAKGRRILAATSRQPEYPSMAGDQMVASREPPRDDPCQDADMYPPRGAFYGRRVAGPVRPQQVFQPTRKELLLPQNTRRQGPLRPALLCSSDYSDECTDMSQGFDYTQARHTYVESAGSSFDFGAQEFPRSGERHMVDTFISMESYRPCRQQARPQPGTSFCMDGTVDKVGHSFTYRDQAFPYYSDTAVLEL